MLLNSLCVRKQAADILARLVSQLDVTCDITRMCGRMGISPTEEGATLARYVCYQSGWNHASPDGNCLAYAKALAYLITEFA